MATWPATLQQKVEASQFELVFGETRVRTDVDVGLAKVRSRFTDSVDQYRATIFVDITEYEDLKVFYKTTLNNGTEFFDWDDPIELVPASFRFLSPPRITHVGGNTFSVSMALEKAP
jgi:hypothetical protein